jgi:hypothetical protein
MKRILIPLIALTGLFASCKKSSSAPAIPPGISATLNGTPKDFSVGATARKSNPLGIANIEIAGAVSLTTGESVLIALTNGLGGGKDSLVVGTYSDTSTRFSVDLLYTISNSNNNDYEGGTFVDGSQVPGIAVTDHLTVVISSITSTNITGSYSGNLYLDGVAPGTGAPWPITGTFNAPLQQQ